jgi:hypothetical protein
MNTNSRCRRIVCAACLGEDGLMVIGPRHWDMVMHEQNKLIGINAHTAEQGFIDQRGVFLNREEAFEVATAAGQIRQKTGKPDSTELFSEDLY